MFGIDLNNLIKTIGYVGIFAIVFAESGLLVGFFLPGDSLLFTAGFLASQGIFNIAILCVVTFVAAVLGDNVGYQFGKTAGPRLFKKEDSLIFSQNNIEKAENFYKKHGGKAIIFARFIPVVRTFAPIIAGVGKMKYSRFLMFNVTGALVWAVGVTLLGYFLGSVIPDVDKYLVPAIIIIVIASVAPSLIHLLKDQERRAEIIAGMKNTRIRRKRGKK